MTLENSDNDLSTRQYLFSLEAIRERSNVVYNLVAQNQSNHFTIDESKLDDAAQHIKSLIERDYGSYSYVPAHGRWRSFEIKDSGKKRDLVSEHIANWKNKGISLEECTRRIIDFFVISVLLDAGAGSKWCYDDKKTKQKLIRTEGLGIASLRMFEAGAFSSDKNSPYQVDDIGLMNFETKDLMDGFQVSESNPLIGAENRAFLLQRLGKALNEDNEYFISSSGGKKRPGNMFDYLKARVHNGAIDIKLLWNLIVFGFLNVWPESRTRLDGFSLGDVWHCEILQKNQNQNNDIGDLIPFHKLSMWLTWSLVEVFQTVAGYRVSGLPMLTGLPEYRNGGFFIDTGVLIFNSDYLKEHSNEIIYNDDGTPSLEVDSQAIIEWRALTIALLDRIHTKLLKILNLDKESFPLNKLLEAGSWKVSKLLFSTLKLFCVSY